ncbi:hypothetical protein [Pseudoxanthomonas mexicana]|uniref:hypothetical protein n=1 Tax=Pseudoxanthomonas mexicana TaxID=128785 RepID=UPI00398AA5EE
MISERRRRGPAGRVPRGFVLAITLWLLAGIAIAVALMTLWSLDQVAQARIGHERLQDEMALAGTRDTLLYLAATRELTYAGLPTSVLAEDQQAVRRLDEMGGLIRDPVGGELSLDDTVYQGLEGSLFSIQDEAGLIPLAWTRSTSLDRFLLQQGIDERRLPRLRDALLDYVDADDLNRLNGAERREYRRAGRSGPPNRRLLVPREIGSVLGWEELSPGQLEAIAARITPYYAGALNLNTVPHDLLPLWLADCPAACDRLLEMRRQASFRSLRDVQGRSGALLGDDAGDYRFVADETLRLTLWSRTGAAWRIHVRLTPLADRRGPWSILASYPIARPDNDEPAEETGSVLFADPAADRH